MRMICLTALALLIAGCGTTERAALQGTPYTACPAERPQICTTIYDPVCGTLNSGETQTFASDCVACGDENVAGYVEGACEAN